MEEETSGMRGVSQTEGKEEEAELTVAAVEI